MRDVINIYSHALINCVIILIIFHIILHIILLWTVLSVSTDERIGIIYIIMSANEFYNLCEFYTKYLKNKNHYKSSPVKV